MTEVLGDFIRTLRAADVRISTSESIDAGAVVDLVGFSDRQVLKTALGQALAKSPDEKETFADCFDRFFAFSSFEQTSGAAAGGLEGDVTGAGPGDGLPVGQAPDLVGMLENGDAGPLQMTLADAARQVGLNQIQLFTQRGLYTRRILEAMGLHGLNAAIGLAQAAGSGGAAQAAALSAARERLRQDVRDYVEKQLQLFTAGAGRRLREEVLTQIRLNNVDRRDFKLMHELVRKMAKRLMALHARRRKKARRGMLDVRQTIRRNIEYEGLLFDVVWKRTRIERPKVMVVCDVSGSVVQVARFLLMFLYSLQDVIPKVRSFAFSGRLGEVTNLFAAEEIEAAIIEALRAHGGGSTDYGQALADLESLALDDVDHRTTVIILGDGRSNYGDPRADILKKIHDRARRVIWLNPEPRSLWNTGDSEMRRLGAYTDRAQTCASLRDLERVVSELLRTAV